MDEPADDDIYLEDQTAGAYLTQARDALLSCGRTDLYRGYAEPREKPNVRERVEAHLRAQGKQLERARTAILFSALSAEAYINGFLAASLSASDYDAVERLPTNEKYVLGPQLVRGVALFDRGAEPAQSIASLFRLRHDLVHPKGKRVRVHGATLVDSRFQKFNPAAAAVFIVRVAEAAATLSDAAGKDRPDTIVRTILDRKDAHVAFGEALRDGVPRPPKELDLAKLLSSQAPRERTRTADYKLPQIARRDPLEQIEAVPRDVMKLFEELSPLPGTATAPLPPDKSGAA